MPDVANLLTIGNLNTPDILSRHWNVVIHVTTYFLQDENNNGSNHKLLSEERNFWLYLFGRRRGRSYVVGVQIAARDAVNKLDFFAVRNSVQWSGNSKIGPIRKMTISGEVWRKFDERWNKPVRSLDNPPVVDILSNIAGNLLLVRRSTLVRVLNGVIDSMAVQPTRWTVRVPQSNLWAVDNFKWLASNNRTQSTLRI